MASEHPMLLTADDVARILNVSRSFAYKMMQDGSIPVVRLGRARRVRPEHLEAFIEANSSGAQIGGARWAT